MPSPHFGSDGHRSETMAPNHGKTKFLRALPHAGDLCACHSCDALRVENGHARVSVNWERDYPPMFYAGVLPEEPEEPIDWLKEFEQMGWDE